MWRRVMWQGTIGDSDFAWQYRLLRMMKERTQQDNHQHAQWSFVCAASDPQIVEQTLADVERYVAQSLDAEVVGLKRTWLENLQ